AIQKIVAVTRAAAGSVTVDGVVTVAAADRVVVFLTIQSVITVKAADDIVAAIAKNLVVTIGADKTVVAAVSPNRCHDETWLECPWL
ncbi:MAG: hypothetical protein RII27_10350, partial [Alphaproteobacteria bacterium]